MLPYKDGVSIIKEVRQNDYVKPLILLTARSEQEDIIKGLEAGADDYLTKPFQSAVLIARIEAHLRRHHKHFLDEIKFEDVMMNTKNREVTIDDQYNLYPTPLTDLKETRLSFNFPFNLKT